MCLKCNRKSCILKLVCCIKPVVLHRYLWRVSMEIYHPRDEELLREMRRVRRSAKRKRLVWGFVIWLVLSIAAGIFVFSRYYQLAVMQGPAMGDTLPAGSLVLVRKAEAGVRYTAGDILLYEKTMDAPVELTILSPKGKIRDYCQYIVYRDLGTTRQYLTRDDGKVVWLPDQKSAEKFESDAEGILKLDTEGMKNGEYWLREVQASYGQTVLLDPIPFNILNPTQVQMKRVLAAPGDRLVLSPNIESMVQINSRHPNRTFTSGRNNDVNIETRRINMRDGEYFVQGDQLSLSVDSRARDFDMITQDEVIGRAEFALWPIRCFGELTGQPVIAESAGQEGAE